MLVDNAHRGVRLIRLFARQHLVEDDAECEQVGPGVNLLAADLLQEGYYAGLAQAVSVPDEYSTAMRVFLLYPIAAFPVSMATTSAARAS